MKICNKCKINKNILEFGKYAIKKDGLNIYCKKCAIENSEEYKKTKQGVITAIYSSQKVNSKRRGHKPPKYTKKELTKWIISQETFTELYNNWALKNYTKMEKPSVDRIDDSKGYSFDNIQLMKWQHNKDKEHIDLKSGKLISQHKKVLQLSMNGAYINEYISIHDAGRKNDIHHTNISAVCRGTRNHTGGFKGKYKEE